MTMIDDPTLVHELPHLDVLTVDVIWITDAQ